MKHKSYIKKTKKKYTEKNVNTPELYKPESVIINLIHHKKKPTVGDQKKKKKKEIQK